MAHPRRGKAGWRDDAVGEVRILGDNLEVVHVLIFGPAPHLEPAGQVASMRKRTVEFRSQAT